MIALFQANTKSVERYFQQLVHANIFWVYTISCRGKRLFVLFNCLIFFDNRCWNCMFLFPWMCFETVHSNALHFETFSWLCLDSMSSRDICVSSGGIGGYLNQFIEESLFDPPVITPTLCIFSLRWKHWSSHSRYLPQSFAEKRSVSCGSCQVSDPLSAHFISLWYHLKRLFFERRGACVSVEVSQFNDTTGQGI